VTPQREPSERGEPSMEGATSRVVKFRQDKTHVCCPASRISRVPSVLFSGSPCCKNLKKCASLPPKCHVFEGESWLKTVSAAWTKGEWDEWSTCFRMCSEAAGVSVHWTEAFGQFDVVWARTSARMHNDMLWNPETKCSGWVCFRS
jgi:hypothetical protein